jgi:hypothetical protein
MYLRQVLPSLEVFRGSWSNFSATGYWTRVGRQFDVPVLGTAAAIMSQALVVAVVALAGWRIRSVRDSDLAYALAIVGMTLASPVAWGHYFVMLVLPLALTWHYLPSYAARGMLIGILAVLWLPEVVFPWSVLGYDQARALTSVDPLPKNTFLCLVALGAVPYTLAGLFLITAKARFSSRMPASAANG